VEEKVAPIFDKHHLTEPFYNSNFQIFTRPSSPHDANAFVWRGFHRTQFKSPACAEAASAASDKDKSNPEPSLLNIRTALSPLPVAIKPSALQCTE
jgi:hypothetical protein